MISFLEKLFAPKQFEPLTFVFPGRVASYKGIATDLYKNNAEFRGYVKECNNYFIKHSDTDLLWIFENGFETEDFAEINNGYIIIIQASITLMLNKRGIFPTNLIGISSGEITALFAAGALDLESFIIISISYVLNLDETKIFHEYYLKLSYEDAVRFRESIAFWSDITFEYDANTVLFKIEEKNAEMLKEICTSRNILCRFIAKTKLYYHTSKYDQQRDFIRSRISNIIIKPLQCDFYSSQYGKMIPKGTLLSLNYCVDLCIKSCKSFSVINAAFDNNITHVVQPGYRFIKDDYFQTFSTKTVAVFDLITNQDISETEHLNKTIKQLEKLSPKLQKDAILKKENNAYQNFLNGFDFGDPDAKGAFKYLRSIAPVHYMPKNDAWLVLNYDDIETILKDDITYSNQLYAAFDTVLMGAAGDFHQNAKDVLTPIFSNVVLNDLASQCTDVASEILSILVEKESFEVVQDFSLPLLNTILFSFFGFTPEDAVKFEQQVLSQKNDGFYNHILKLDSFFSECVSNPIYKERKGVVCEILKLIETGKFKIEESINLLRLFWIASSETTLAFVSILFYTVLSEKTIVKTIIGKEQLMSKFVEECLRLETSGRVRRITTTPVEIAGHDLPVGSQIIINLNSANTDSKYFDDPYLFSINRPAKRHLAFGAGLLQCIGMGLARALGRAALKSMIDKHESLQYYRCKEWKLSPSFATFHDDVALFEVEKMKS